MNPWALVIIGLGILLIIIGVQGTQHDIAGAVTGSSKTSSTSKKSGSGGGSAKTETP